MNHAETTQLLRRIRRGDPEAQDALFERVYDQLHGLARRQLRRGPRGALQTTELVHEAYLKLCDAARLSTTDRAHFFALSAQVMRQILVDRFRRQSARKRGGPTRALPLQEGLIPVDDRGETLLAIDEALTGLSRLNERTGRVVELKFFGGMTEPEIAEVLGISVRTVNTEWRKARAWLARELSAA
jgi:RNA polymerase sigma factor (TIGR02999 family)